MYSIFGTPLTCMDHGRGKFPSKKGFQGGIFRDFQSNFVGYNLEFHVILFLFAKTSPKVP